MAEFTQRISVVIPVYRGATTLPTLIGEIIPLTVEKPTPSGRFKFVVSEILLVHDCGPDCSDEVIEDLNALHPDFVRPVWLSRNFGQHAATLAGMATSTGDWIVTIDEDGQQDPADIGRLLETAVCNSSQVVYATPTGAPPHGWVRNTMSRLAKKIASALVGDLRISKINSFRLIDGEIGRTLAAYCGSGVYLDVGLFWISERIRFCSVALRKELSRPSGYSFLTLLRHFWHLVLTTGVRPLRLITVMGLSSIIVSITISGYALYGKFFATIPVQGWTSLLIIIAFFSGCILTALGVIAEYMAITMGVVMGKPLYVVSSKPTRSGRQL